MSDVMLALVFAGIASVEPAAPDPVFLRLERSGCFGTCPIYAIEVTRAGVLRYDGERFVKTMGRRERTLSPAQLAELRAGFARARFMDLSEHCCDCYDWTDMPGAMLTFVGGGASKTIHDYHGCGKAPKAIRTLEDDVDRIVVIESLIGAPPERPTRER